MKFNEFNVGLNFKASQQAPLRLSEIFQSVSATPYVQISAMMYA